MKVIVVGCGKIGTTLIGSLVAEGHDVTAIDIDAEVIGGITDLYDVMTVVGNGVDCDTLEEAGAPNARLLVAVTPKDEVNILCCFLAKRMGAHHTVARIEDPNCSDRELAFIKQHTGVSMFIKPSQLVAGELANMLQLPTGVRAEYFARRSFEMIEIRIKERSVLSGLSLLEMRKKIKGNYLILAVNRGGSVKIPDGNFVLKSGDEIMFGSTTEGIGNLLKELGYLADRARNVMILGGSRTAYYLADSLTKLGTKVKIIEQSRERCRELCELVPKAVMIHGDGSKGDLLEEEGIQRTDAFVTLTGIDEQNLLMSIYAQKNHVKRALCKLDRSEFVDLAEQMGMEEFVSPRRLLSDAIIRYARAIENSEGSKMEMLYRLMDDKVEASEFIVHPGFKYVNIPLIDLRKRMKDNILLGGILRNSKLIIPGGEDVILEGDRVIVVAANHQIHDLTDIVAEDKE